MLKQVLGVPTRLKAGFRIMSHSVGLGPTTHLWRVLCWLFLQFLGRVDGDVGPCLLMPWWSRLVHCSFALCLRDPEKITSVLLFIARLRKCFPVVWDDACTEQRSDQHANSLSDGVGVVWCFLLMDLCVSECSWSVIVEEKNLLIWARCSSVACVG